MVKGTHSGLAFCRAALRNADRRPGEGLRVIFDIDNTLVDTRARTRAAADHFARKSEVYAPLAGLPLAAIRYDGRETARARGLDAAAARAFHADWDRFFWRPESLRHDRPIRATVQLARQAKAAGAEVFYLTGRVDSLKEPTIGQLRRLGLPDADAAHVICKPSVRVKTAPFKQQVVADMLRQRCRIAWFMSDSRTDIAAAQRVLSPRACVLVDFPVQPAGPQPDVDRSTPVLRIRP